MAESLDLNAPDTAPLSPARRMADETTPFKPAWWLRNPHLQTLWPVFFRRRLRPPLRRERLELPDGDFVDLDWTLNASGPIVIILHGLEGSSRSHYARGMLTSLPQHGMRAVLMHFRGCSGEPNRLARAYHSGDTGDIDFLVRTLKAREPNTPLAAIGYSLGGNALLKWLGEQGKDAPLQCAVAVSVPFLLHEATARMNRGLSRVYQWHLLKSLKQRRAAAKASGRFAPPAPLEEINQMKGFFEFDDRVTARLHGFDGCNALLHLVQLAPIPEPHPHPDPDRARQRRSVHACAGHPRSRRAIADIELDLHRHGGHVGFVGGHLPWKPRYWLDERIPAWLQQRM